MASSKALRLATNLTLPLDAVTQTIAILAKRRAGKSYTMRRLVEQLFNAGQQVVIVDPKGDQWGVRSSADGKGPGLAIVILGGERGDVPLEPGGGEVVAKLVVEERVSVLLDVSLFRKHEVATFMTAFLENLYRLKAREMYRTPMMLVIDEADAIAPQKPQKGEERMLGAAEDIVRRGGQRGIGCVLVTQRSAVLNKNVLTQAQMLVALRTIAPQDLAAMNAWIDVHGTLEQKQTLMESLPSLPIGDAWFWSPGWPTTTGIFKRVHVLPIETFDSGATPKSGEKRVEPKRAADVDLEALKRQMTATIEKAKADDPRELRRQLTDLKKELAHKEAMLADVDVRTKRIDEKLQRVTDRSARATATAANTELKADLVRYRRALEAAMKILVKVKAIDFAVDSEDGQKALAAAVAEAVRQVTAPIEKRVTALVSRVEVVKLAAKHAEEGIAALLAEKIDLTVQVEKREPFTVAKDRPAAPRREPRARQAAENSDGTVKGAEQRILNALAELAALGVEEPERVQVAFFAGYTHLNSKGLVNALGALRTNGFIDYPTQGRVVMTAAGESHAQPADVPATADELRDRVVRMLGGASARILEPLIKAYPKPMAMQDLAAAAGYGHLNSKGFVNARGRLRSLGFIDYPQQGQVAAQPVLFLE